MAKNIWKTNAQKHQIRSRLAVVVDDCLDSEGYYGGMECGEISDAEAERTYQLLVSLIHRLSEEWTMSHHAE